MPSRLTVVLVSLLVATPAVMFWLWLVTLPTRMAKLCPEDCKCDPGGYQVMCLGSPLNSFPLIFPTDVRELLLGAINITTLQKDIFMSRGLTELEKLSARTTDFRKIELGAFNGLTKLTHLSMPYNQISEIIPGTFEKMSRLEYLDLSFNGIEHLEVDAFSELINLNYIDLRGNKLQSLHPDTFVGMPRLAEIKLAHNRNLQIPTDRHFIISHSLSHLDIRRCNVSSVSVETFGNITALELLDLRENNLRSVDINILKVLPKLSALYLCDNPLQCDCQLQEVWRWCQEHNVQTAYYAEPPECDTPSEVQGMWWGVLEKGQCLQDNIYYYGDYKNTSYNYTATEGRPFYFFESSFLKYYEAPIYAVPFIFGTTGNVILLIIITCNKDMRTVPNMYILNLAVSDMIYLIVSFSEACANTVSDTWQYGKFMCKFLPFCRRLSVGLSAYSVAVLSIQRYRITVNPLHVRVSSQPTWRATGATICGVWIVAALFALPSVLSERVCRGCDSYGCDIYYQRVVVFELLISCVLPVCVIAFSYIMTARLLLNDAGPLSEVTQSPQLNARRNSARIVIGLTVVFLISYVPYHAYWTYFIFNEIPFLSRDWTHYFNRQNNFAYTKFISTCLIIVNSCLNPVALFCTSLAFRRQFKRYLTCCCKANPTATDIEFTRRN